MERKVAKMAFQGIEFIFDDIPSSSKGLYLMSSSTGEQSVSLGANYNILTDKTNLSKPYLIGMTDNEALSFDLSIMSEVELDRFDVSNISRWLFSHKTYKNLKIVQDDMADIYYKCKLNDPQLIMFGNIIRGFKCKVVCDCGYAYEKPITLSKTLSGGRTQFTINNLCDSNDYKFPLIKLYPNKANGVVSIVNLTEGNRETKFINLIQGEVLELDNELKIIKSDRVDYNMERFNKKFFRLIPNLNQIQVTGDISHIEVTYEFLRRVGG